jgi:soluble lytic murein transglycosylase-like protein
MIRKKHPRPTCTQRRRWLTAGVGGALLKVTPMARAGGQVEEPLIDSVRSALSAAVSNSAPPKPVFVSSESRQGYLAWHAEMSDRLERQLPDALTRSDLLETLWYESRRAGLDEALVLGIVQVESGFRKYAISSAGARGYMQVMPFWAKLIGDGEPSRLFHMQTNLRFGCVIMRHYLDIERGNLFLALGRYNGSRGRAEYPDLVFGAKRRWEMSAAA